MLVLAMEVNETGTESLQFLQWQRRTVDESSRAPARPDLAAHHQLSIFETDVEVGQPDGLLIAVDFEEPFDRALVRTGADKFSRGGTAENRIQGTHENRFARAGLTCDHIETRSKLDFGLLYQSEGLDVQSAQHDVSGCFGVVGVGWVEFSFRFL